MAARPAETDGRAPFWRRLLRAESGNPLVEFALVAPIYIALLLGLVEFGRAFWIRNTLQFAAEETGRYAMASLVTAPAQLTAKLQSQLSGLNAAQVNVQFATDSVGGTNYITITADYPFDYLAPILPFGPTTLTGRSRVPLIP